MSLKLAADFSDLLAELLDADVEFMLIGAHAMAVHGVVRSTGDMDIFVRPSDSNAARVMTALARFGAPLKVHGVTAAHFATAGNVYQLGLPPCRIDIINRIAGVGFDDAWASCARNRVGDLTVPVIGLAELIRNKAACGRAKDLADLALLKALPSAEDIQMSSAQVTSPISRP